MRITTPSPEDSDDGADDPQEPVPKGSKSMMQRLRDKFKDMVSVILCVIFKKLKLAYLIQSTFSSFCASYHH